MKVGYARVSKAEQSENNSLEQQITRLENAGASMVFTDVESGRSDSRTQFNKMLAFCKKGGVTEIIATRIDRLGRSVVTIHNTFKLFEELNVKVNILDAPIDSSSAFGWFSINQMAGLAECESRLTQDRIKHGYKHLRQLGKANPQCPFGYLRVDEQYRLDFSKFQDTDLSVFEVSRKIVRYFVETPNTSVRQTARYALKLGKYFSASGLKLWLTSPTLNGHTVYNITGNHRNPDKWDLRRNTHEALITDDELKIIKQKIEENRSKYSYGANIGKMRELPLRKQIICGDCGYPCYYYSRILKTTQEKVITMRCAQRDRLGEIACKNKKSTPLKEILQLLDNKLAEKAELLTDTVGAVEMGDEEAESEEVKKLKEQLEGLKALPHSDVIQQAIDKILEELNDIKNYSPEKVLQKHQREDLEKVKRSFSKPGLWESLPSQERHRIYKQLVDKIVVLNGNILSIELFI